MPIYAYRCGDCGFEKDVLQRLSDPLLTDCPSCGKSAFVKQLTAAGFQLKGSGWYATDFKSGTKSSDRKSGDDSTSAADAPAKDAPAKDAPAKDAPAKETATSHSCGGGACPSCS
jgi:putative FmdB family regulatory protein